MSEPLHLEDAQLEELAGRIAEKAKPLRILRSKDAAEKIGVKKTRFYEVCKQPGFPRRVTSEATGVSGWWEHELDAWLAKNYRR